MTGPSRVSIDKQSPTVYRAIGGVAVEIGNRAAQIGLDRSILELVNIRVSQLNRCAFCLDLHSHRALAAGETPQRIAVLPAWREVDLYSDRERAALEIAEAVTQVNGEHLDDEQYALLRRFLSDDEISLLVWGAVTINAFNRVSILSGHRVRERSQP